MSHIITDGNGVDVYEGIGCHTAPSNFIVVPGLHRHVLDLVAMSWCPVIIQSLSTFSGFAELYHGATKFVCVWPKYYDQSFDFEAEKMVNVPLRRR